MHKQKGFKNERKISKISHFLKPFILTYTLKTIELFNNKTFLIRIFSQVWLLCERYHT